MGLVRYGFAATLARLADEMVGVAVVLLVLGRGGGAGLAGAAVAGYTLPAVLTGPFLGAWLAGTARPRFALLANELTLALVAAGLVLGVGHLPAALVIGMTTVAGICLPLTSGGFSSLVPRLVGRDQLARANIVDAATFNLAAMGGPAVAGLLAATVGPGVAVLGIAGSAALAAVATALIPIGPALGGGSALLDTTRAGLSHLVRTPPLRAATLTTMLSTGLVGLLVVALPVHAARIGARAADGGFVWAAIEVGAVAATVLISPRLRAVRPERVVFAGVGLFGTVVVLWPVASNFGWLVALAVLAGVANGPVLPAVFGARQRYSPGPLLAQVSTTGASLKIAAFAIGSAAGGQLVPWLGADRVLLVVGAGQLVAALAGRITTSGRPSPAPSDAPARTGR